MAADNLTIQISADSSKLRADLSLAQAELRKLQKELRAASDAGDKARVADLSTQYEGLAAQIRKTSRALGEHNKVARDAAGELNGVARVLNNIGSAAEQARTAFRALFALEGMRQAKDIISSVYDDLNNIQKLASGTGFTPQGVKTFQEILGDVGVSTEGAGAALSRFNEAVVEAKEKAGLFKTGMEGGVRVLRGTGDAAAAAADNIKVMRGEVSNLGDPAGINVMRGSQKAAQDTSFAFGKLAAAMHDIGKSFDVRQFKTQEDRIRGVSGALADLNKVAPDLAASIGRGIFGRNYAEIAEGILKVGEAWNKTQDELNKTGRMPTDADRKAVKEYLAAVDGVSDAWEAAKKKSVLATHDTTIEVLGAAADFIQAASDIDKAFNKFVKTSGTPLGGTLVTNTKREFEGLITFFGTTLPDVVNRGYAAVSEAITNSGILSRNQDEVEKLRQTWSAFATYMNESVWTPVVNFGIEQFNAFLTYFTDTFIPAFTAPWERAWTNLKQAGSDALDWIKSKLADVSTAIGTAATAGAPVGPGGFAAGGYVRGPGSGTSDSILARLSNGEFIMRAAAVRAWGPQLLGAMNALNRPLRGVGDGKGFANGGMVSARTGDGTTVNLHFPGHSFALRGDRGIVMGLTREARRAALLSGGRAPGAAVI